MSTYAAQHTTDTELDDTDPEHRVILSYYRARYDALLYSLYVQLQQSLEELSKLDAGAGPGSKLELETAVQRVDALKAFEKGQQALRAQEQRYTKRAIHVKVEGRVFARLANLPLPPRYNDISVARPLDKTAKKWLRILHAEHAKRLKLRQRDLDLLLQSHLLQISQRQAQTAWKFDPMAHLYSLDGCDSQRAEAKREYEQKLKKATGEEEDYLRRRIAAMAQEMDLRGAAPLPQDLRDDITLSPANCREEPIPTEHPALTAVSPVLASPIRSDTLEDGAQSNLHHVGPRSALDASLPASASSTIPLPGQDVPTDSNARSVGSLPQRQDTSAEERMRIKDQIAGASVLHELDHSVAHWIWATHATWAGAYSIYQNEALKQEATSRSKLATQAQSLDSELRKELMAEYRRHFPEGDETGGSVDEIARSRFYADVPESSVVTPSVVSSSLPPDTRSLASRTRASSSRHSSYSSPVTSRRSTSVTDDTPRGSSLAIDDTPPSRGQSID